MEKSHPFALSILLILILIFALYSEGYSEIYRYVDKNGVWHFTNVYTDSRYKVYSDKPEDIAIEQVKRAQMLLTKLGYNPGLPDGLLGTNTSQAIKKFQQDFRIPVTGIVDKTLIVRLEIQVLLRVIYKKPALPLRHVNNLPLPALALPTMVSNWGSTPLTPDALFHEVQSSIFIVLAANYEGSGLAAASLRQGSAVAISSRHLLTNYHVVKGCEYILIRQNKKETRCKIAGKDEGRDMCVLVVQDFPLSPVRAVQVFEKLAVGQKAYSVGAPFGLENTLGDGLISGLRNRKGVKLIQTTAQISGGSSGGGLFDDCGNLIGITTFQLKRGQNINFAIAASHYWE